MRTLLDTSAMLWWATDSRRLSRGARAVIEDPANALFFSVASAWEIAIKAERGHLQLPTAAEQYVPDLLRRFDVEVLPVDLSHALRAGALPPHHRDPFDRLLVAQAQIENLAIVTSDPAIGRYDVDVIS